MPYYVARQTDFPPPGSVTSDPGPSSSVSDPSIPPSSVPPSSSQESSSSSSESSSVPSSSEPSSVPSSSEPPSSSERSSSASESASSSQRSLLEITAATSTSAATSFTTVVTSVNGQLTTYTSPLPTALVNAQAGQGNVSRTSMIAGITSALIVLLLLILAAIFVCRRHKLRRQMEVIIAEKKRKEGKSLLDGEGFYDDEDVLAMREYDDPLPPAGGIYARPVSPTLSMIRSRASETGSIFREEVWPPPVDDLVDPISKGSSQVDLSRIVDDVMGPTAAGHDRQGTGSTLDSTYSAYPNDRERSESTNHSVSVHSNAESAHSQYTDPFHSRPGSTSYSPTSGTGNFFLSSGSFPARRSPSPPVPPPVRISQRTPLTTLYRPPPTESHPQQRSVSSPHQVTSTSATSHTQNRAATRSPPSTVSSRASTQPKRSSPLARALTQDAKLWLSRSPHTDAKEGGKTS